MLAQKEFVKVFETLVTRFPYMADPVKLNIHMKRKDILLFIQMAEIGLASPDLRGLLTEDMQKELRAVIREMLERGKLNEFLEGLQDLLGLKEKA